MDDKTSPPDWKAMSADEKVAALNDRGLLSYTAVVIVDMRSGEELAREIVTEPRMTRATLDSAGSLMFIIEDDEDDASALIH